MMESGLQLPSKEAGLFKKMLKCYEQKQYKMLLKFAKQILSNPKCSEHGETLAMKGLTLNNLGKREEAYECAKLGLKNALSSPVCWHVYGLLNRSDHKYDEAIKCFRNALKWSKDKENLQILRDLSLLQIQMRDLEGYQKTRYQLLKLRATQRASWIGFAMSYHLLKDYDMASNILEEFCKTTSGSNGAYNSKQPVYDYEMSELILYQIMIYKEGGKYDKALEYLNQSEYQICDKLSLLETRVELLLKLHRNEEASQILRQTLINRNPDGKAYYEQLEFALQIEDNEQKKLDLYKELQSKYPRASQPFRRPLMFVNNKDVFRTLVDAYMRKALRKGQPALFRDLKFLYVNENKHEIIGQLLQQYEQNLLDHLSFDDDLATANSEDCCTLIWVRYYLSQHLCYFSKYNEAMELVDKCLLHTPTLIDLYVLKGKIYKKMGELVEAVNCLNEAQSLDTADRYLNSKCAKYMLRANMINDAEQMCSKFTREGMPAAENLNEMQCMWFQSEAANAYYRLNQIGQALKKCIEIERHFAEMQEDQFDFHTYCMRKMTLRAYVGLLRLEDTLKNHPFYFKAAILAIKIYLELYDNPDRGSSSDLLPKEQPTLHPIENGHTKKSKKEKKQAKAEANKVEQNKQNNQQNRKEKEETFSSSLHTEPLIPAELEKPKTPLVEAERFLKPLQKLSSNLIETHLLSFDLYLRKKKPLLMLKHLKQSVQIQSNHSQLRRQLQTFADYVQDHQQNLDARVLQVVNIELPKIQAAVASGDIGFSSTSLEQSFLKLSV